MQSAPATQNINSNTNSACQNNHGQKLHENGTCIFFCYTHYGAHHSPLFSGNNCMHRIPSPPPPPRGKEKPQWGADRLTGHPGHPMTAAGVAHGAHSWSNPSFGSCFCFCLFRTFSYSVRSASNALSYGCGHYSIVVDGLLIFIKLNYSCFIYEQHIRYDVMEFPHCFRCFVEEYQQIFLILKRVPIVRHPTSSCTFQVIVLTECPTVCGSRAPCVILSISHQHPGGFPLGRTCQRSVQK